MRIIVVHGRGTKPSKPCKLRYIREVLIEGVRRVDTRCGAWLSAHSSAIQLAYYADLFSTGPGERPEACASFRGPIDRLYDESRRCPSWVTFRAFLQGMEVDAAALLVRFLRRATRAQLVAREFPDVMRYLRDHALASQVRARLQALLVPALRRREPVVLLAHSLGSVIAYDVLWKLSHTSEYAALRHRPIACLVTMGSPLGDKFIKTHLLGWRYPRRQRFPTNIREWSNLSARGDIVCHDERLANDFAPMLAAGSVGRFEEHTKLCTVYRGREGRWNPHKLYGYLVLPELGRILARHLRKLDYLTIDRRLS